jgi:DUF1365 family protein
VSISRLYTGTVTHHRLLPKVHRFTYRVLMPFVMLDEVEALTGTIPLLHAEGDLTGIEHPQRRAHARPRHFTIRRSDFLPDRPGSLDSAARALYRELVDEDAPGRIGLLANWRSLAWNFNPIAIFFFYEGDEVVCAIAEVTNTPWGERHCYLLDGPGTTEFDKAHHVSPFLDMRGRYRLTYRAPTERFTLSMGLSDLDEADQVADLRFTASMRLEGHPMDGATVAQLTRWSPDAALRVSAQIYLQAVRLWLKGVRFLPHPSKRSGKDHG